MPKKRLKKGALIIRILILICAISVITTIIPALLNARNDLAVIIGMLSVIGLFIGAFYRGQETIEFFKDIEEEV